MKPISMTTPGNSTASLVPDHDDSVENEEEDNSSIPMSQDSVENANEKPNELKVEDDEKGNSSDIDDREAFKLWCRVFEPEYVDKSEEGERFKYFKDSLDRKVNPSMLKYCFNHLEFAEIQ